jgi:hypothetical protein
MKRMYLILMVGAMGIFSMATAISCPFNFHNDSGKPLLVSTTYITQETLMRRKGARGFVQRGATQLIEHGHKNNIYVYPMAKRYPRRRYVRPPSPYVLEYTITENYCPPAGAPLETIKYSDLKTMKRFTVK